MRRACPVPGEEWDKLLTVWLNPGEEVKEHAHKRHAVLYYPEDCDPIYIDAELVKPTAGTVLYLPPGTLHTVPPVTRRRLSVAMLVSDALPLEK